MTIDIAFLGWFVVALALAGVTCLIDWICRRLAIRAYRKEQNKDVYYLNLNLREYRADNKEQAS